MTSKRLHLILLISIGVTFLLILGGAYGVTHLISTRADKLITIKAKAAALDEQQSITKRNSRLIKEYADLYKITRAVVPEDKDQAETVRQLVNIADANGVALANITFPASTLGNGVAPASGASGAAATPPAAAINDKTAALSQLTPVKNIPGVYSLTITVQSDASRPVRYDKFISFLDALEHNRRTAQVTTIALQPDKADPSLVSFNLTLNEYIKP